jgi:hypothetical protein
MFPQISNKYVSGMQSCIQAFRGEIETYTEQVGNLCEHARAKWATQLRGIHATRVYNCVNIAKCLVQNKWLFYVENGYDLN